MRARCKGCNWVHASSRPPRARVLYSFSHTVFFCHFFYRFENIGRAHIVPTPPLLASVNSSRAQHTTFDPSTNNSGERIGIASSTVSRSLLSRSWRSSSSKKTKHQHPATTHKQRWRTNPGLRTSKRPSRSRRDAACASPR